MIESLAAIWSIGPLRWILYLGVALAVAYVLWARVKRWTLKDQEQTRLEKVILFPFALIAAILSWAFNWTGGTVLWWDSGPSWPVRWNETFSKRIQRTVDYPNLYPYRALWLSHKLKPLLNRHDKGHID